MCCVRLKHKWLSLVLVVLLLVSGCTKDTPTVYQNMRADSEIGALRAPNKDSEIVFVNGQEQSVPAGTPYENSYFCDSFSEAEQSLYETLKDNYKAGVTEIELAMDVTAEELRRVIRIILLDEPAFFYIEKRYEFSMRGDYVDHVRLFYRTEISEIVLLQDEYKGYMAKSMVVGKSEFATTTALCEEMLDKNRLDEAVSDPAFKETLSDTVYGAVLRGAAIGNEGVAKLLTALLRASGVETMTVYGVLTNNEMKEYGYAMTDSRNPEIVTLKEDDYYQVQMDTSDLYAWNLVRLNNKWYHIDMTYNMLVHNAERMKPFASLKLMPFFCLSDEQAASSRNFYPTEALLGIQPMAESRNFIWAYRKGAPYIASSSKPMLATNIKEQVALQLHAGAENILIQFADTELYYYFKDNADQVLSQISGLINISFSVKDVLFYPSGLIAAITGVTYK